MGQSRRQGGDRDRRRARHRRGTARLLAREGARVVVADMLEERARLVAKEIGGAARLRAARRHAGGRLAPRGRRDALRATAAIDVLVNNAAVLHMAAIEDTSLADYERVVRVNQVGTFLGIRAVAPVMRERGPRLDRERRLDRRHERQERPRRLLGQQVGGARHDARGRGRARQVRRARERGLPRGRQRGDDAPYVPAGGRRPSSRRRSSSAS